MHSEPDYSDDIAREIDAEIRRIIDEAHQRARDILVEHREHLESLSDILLRRETIEREEFIRLLDGEPEAEVFRVKDEKARQRLAEGPPPTTGKAPAPRRLPLPPAAPGQPVPEA
jgi:cell division protease FtsH